jgi:hypothetical protein
MVIGCLHGVSEEALEASSMLPCGHVSELSVALQMVLHHLREGDVPAAGDEVNSRTNSGFWGPGNHSISLRPIWQ